MTDKIILQDVFNIDTFFISDHHFGHKFVESFEPSRTVATKLDGCDTFEEMLIERHNSVVKKDDNVVFLGDFSFNSPSNWASKLNGKKYLILGNHDRPNHQSYGKDFEYIFKGAYMDWNGLPFVFTDPYDGLLSSVSISIEHKLYLFCHYPLGKMNEEHDFMHEKMVSRINTLNKANCIDEEISSAYDFIVHGHTHSDCVYSEYTKYINTSCENIDFTPKRLRDLI